MARLPAVLAGEPRPSDPAYRDALMTLNSDDVSEAAEDLIRVYRATNDLSYRGKALRLLVDNEAPGLETFFAEAYARERYLDMKIGARRGLAQFASEADIEKRLVAFRRILARREQSTPLNFAEYESLLSPSSLPCLVERYGYALLQQTLEQVRQQYDRMPDEAKGLLGEDPDGQISLLVSHDEYDRRVRTALDVIADRRSPAL